MQKKFSLQKGALLIEILIVITTLAIIATLIFASFARFNSTQTLIGTTQTILAMLDEARTLTLASKNNLSYSVHFESSKVVLFTGTTYSASDPDNDETKLSRHVTISNIALNGILDEYQIVEAKSIGADAILLIAACLSEEEIKKLHEFAASLQLEVLIEGVKNSFTRI